MRYLGTPGASLWAITDRQGPNRASKGLARKIRDYQAEGAFDVGDTFPFLPVGVHCLYRCQFQVPAENRSPFCDLDVARSLRKKFGIALGKGATAEARKLSKKIGVELASRIAN